MIYVENRESGSVQAFPSSHKLYQFLLNTGIWAIGDFWLF